VSSERDRRLGLVFTPGEIQDGLLREATVALVDVLRATSVIPRAFASGAARVIPADSVEHATGLLASLDRKTTLLCGEREGKKIAGFHLGNSPLEYTPKAVKGKTLIFSSTNGSQAMMRCLAAPEQILASFVNATAAVERLLDGGRDILVVCSGKLGRSALEDAVLGGLLVERLLARAPELVTDDGALMARTLWRRWEEDVAGMLAASSHGTYLASLGFEADLEFCSRVDSVRAVPVLKDGRIEPEIRPAAQPRSQAST
jgi:2-phosphosulfolactate phosphatase